MALDPLPRSELIAAVPAFSALDAATLDSLAAELDEHQLDDGSVLMRQGDPADALYFVTRGELNVSVARGGGRPVVVDVLTSGAVIGEMALLAGNRRSATVTARGPATVARFTRAAFDKLTAAQPGLREQVVSAITPRLERVQLAAVLEDWFGVGTDDAAAIQELQASTEWLTLPAGSALYRPGDRADCMYVVVSGRLTVTPEDPDASSYQATKGESVGELGVLGGGTRSETATASRDSHLVRVPVRLVESHAPAMRRIARIAIDRLTPNRAAVTAGDATDGRAPPPRSGRVDAVHKDAARTIALHPAHPAAPVRELATLLEAQLLRGGQTLVLDEAFVKGAFGGSLPAGGSALDASLTHWLNELEAENAFLVLLADPASSAPWVERTTRQADVVLVVADASAPPDEQARPAPPGAQLVLLHLAWSAAPTGTAAWLERTGVVTWHHVRAGDAFGVPRLVRRLTGQAVGLVFSGGGARGYAHIGLLRAIHELGIEIDMVAGTSMGALIGATYAFKSDWTEVERAAVMFGDKKRLLDNTLPLVALTASKGVTTTFKDLFADSRIEDMWTPFVCVSANLFEAVPVEHSTGPIWEAVRASTAIPGVFTPLVHDGDLLVDGAVMNAFPVDLMREMVGSGVVIASSAMAKSPRREPYDFGPSVSGWRALAQYLKPRKRRTRYPSMIKTLMEATSVGSKHQSTIARTLADVVVEMPVQGFGKLEFHRHEELIELGYSYALEALGEWVGAADHPHGADLGTTEPGT